MLETMGIDKLFINFLKQVRKYSNFIGDLKRAVIKNKSGHCLCLYT